MHYVRFLRAPKLLQRGNLLQVQLLFTITTDLGDSFLYPEKFLNLQITATAASSVGSSTWLLSDPGRLSWEPGMRVAKPNIDVPVAFRRALDAGAKIQICVRAADSRHMADGVDRVLALASEKPRYRREAAEKGGVMPAWISLNPPGEEAEFQTRRVQLLDSPDGLGHVEIEEEIGESIARHIWDGGVVALCAIAGIASAPDSESTRGPCMKAFKEIVGSKDHLRVLELGCGVGILGVGLGAVYPKLHAGKCTILMTDLEEAEERARANIARLEPRNSDLEEQPVQLLYENLDWEDARLGQFGPEAQSQPWDMVMLSDCTYNVDMLPALVETLSAIHTANTTHLSDGGNAFSTKVFLATKPRHPSERALFDLMSKEGWGQLHKQELLVPVLGAQPQTVELYLFEKSEPTEPNDNEDH